MSVRASAYFILTSKMWLIELVISECFRRQRSFDNILAMWKLINSFIRYSLAQTTMVCYSRIFLNQVDINYLRISNNYRINISKQLCIFKTSSRNICISDLFSIAELTALVQSLSLFLCIGKTKINWTSAASSIKDKPIVRNYVHICDQFFNFKAKYQSFQY